MKTLYSLKESSCSILIFVIPSGKDDLEHWSLAIIGLLNNSNKINGAKKISL